MEMTPMWRSRALKKAGYDAGTRTLRVEFRNGGLYDYLEVPNEVYDGLVSSEHPWTEWGEHITSTYDYRRIG